MPRLEFLDAGRGIAILGVIAVHTVEHFSTGIPLLNAVIGTGQFGVQLFYIISAYTMQHTLSSRVGRESRPIQNFWIRRYCRIAIPFWAGMAVYESFRAMHAGYYASLSADVFSLMTSFLLIQGFWPTSLSSIVPGGGTIAIEMIFYAIFPAIFCMRGSVTKLAICGCLVILLDHAVLRPLYRATFVLFDAGLSAHDIRVFFYYYVLNQCPTFLFGIYVYILRTQGFRRSHLFAVIPFLLVYAIVSPKLAAISLIGTGLVLGLSQMKSPPTWLIWVGRYSYSLYLFHFAVLNLLIIGMERFLERKGLIVFAVGYSLAVGGALIISLITKPLLEDVGTAIGRWLVAFNERRRGAVAIAAKPSY
jgi:peptidoglycan/LPS O-acetylase OafA/YrhL